MASCVWFSFSNIMFHLSSGKSRRCSLLWATWRKRTVSQYTVSREMTWSHSAVPLFCIFIGYHFNTFYLNDKSCISCCFEWFLGTYSGLSHCYGCSDIIAGGVGVSLFDVFCGWCLSNQFWTRLVPGQEEAGWVQWQKLGGLLLDNGGSQAVDKLSLPVLPQLWHQFLF